MPLTPIQTQIRKKANKKKADFASRFFKTGKGEYGEGRKSLGVITPELRKIARENYNIPLSEIQKILRGEYSEERFTALAILCLQFKKAKIEKEQKKIYDFYIKNIKYINNWDLVDISAPYIIGPYLFENSSAKKILYKFANSKDLWLKRISVLSTFYFIRNNQFDDTLKISKILLNDEHDLIHKAVGWMIREVGNKDLKTEENFLKKHYKKMPRTMLRYAIEKFSEPKRKKYLLGKI